MRGWRCSVVCFAFCCLKSPSVGQDRLILPRLRSGDRKLQRGRFVYSCPICARHARHTSVGQDRLILPCLRSGDRKLQSIARWTAKNAKVRKDLNILRAVPMLLIKVLADLKDLRAAFFYRHLGPHGPKEVPAAASRAPAPHPNRPHPVHPGNPAHPASDNRKNAPPQNRWRVLHFLCNSRKVLPLQVLKDLHVYSTPAREGS